VLRQRSCYNWRTQLDDAPAEYVSLHLERCGVCRGVVAETTADGFPNRLQQAQNPQGTPVPSKCLSPQSRVIQGQQVDKTAVPGELLNSQQYDVLRELGRGGMGIVYLAHNKLMDRLEVLKVLNNTVMDRPDSLERFLREIRAAAKLNHDNVVKAYSAVQLGDLLVFAMEYVEGEDLAQLVKQKGRLPIGNACRYTRLAALGLQHAHEKQLVHRDIKPQNLILTRAGNQHVVKILDFGLAKASSEKKFEPKLTGPGRMLGTPDFSAPEQILDAATADIRADIYSLGCTLYYLLTGAAAFRADHLVDLLHAHQSQEAKPLNLVRPEVPVELASVVAKMMAKDPAKRYQKPADVGMALLPFLNPAPIGIPPPPEAAPGPQPTAGPPERIPIGKSVCAALERSAVQQSAKSRFAVAKSINSNQSVTRLAPAGLGRRLLWSGLAAARACAIFVILLVTVVLTALVYALVRTFSWLARTFCRLARTFF
jgi:serine/threonine protein kinase